ncbi:MAG: carboxyl transferase domain-containing protein, partial [Pseudomonadota bacterium]
MAAFESAIAKGSAVFDQRRAEMLALVDQMRRVYGRAAALSEKRRPRFQERGQLTPRDRLSLLLDQGLPWLELYPFANYLAEDPDPETSVPGASVLAGIGFVSGARVMVLASDSGINAGAMGAMASAKMQRCMDMALRHKLPLIHLIESAGANLMTYTVEMWAEGGGLFARLARLSAAGVPTVAVLHGPSTAGGAYYPGMSDYVIGVRGWGQASLGGAALVKAATGEDADEEDLAGVDMHATVSGLVEYVAEDDAHALCLARQVVADLDWNAGMAPVFRPHAAPVLDADDLAGVVPVDYREAYDVRDVFARILDGSAFTDFKPGYGATMVCTKGAIHGHAVGILGNNGPIDNQGATKAAQFMQLCDQAGHPLVFLHNI